MPAVRVDSKGRFTIPKELRDRLGIRAPGLARVTEEERRIVMEPVK